MGRGTIFRRDGVLRNSEARMLDDPTVSMLMSLRMTKGRWWGQRQWAHCWGIHEWSGDHGSSKTAPGWSRLMESHYHCWHTLLLSLLLLLPNLNFLYSVIRPPAHFPPLGSQCSRCIVDPLSCLLLPPILTSFLRTLDSEACFIPFECVVSAVNPLSIQLAPHPWLDPTFHLP